MGWFFNKQDEVKVQEIQDPLLSALMRSDIITREQAMQLPRVASNVDLISSMIAVVPVKLYRKGKDGLIEEVENDYRINLLNKDTHDLLDGFQWKKSMVIDYLMGSGGYSFVDWKRNMINGLYYVECEKVTPRKNDNPIYKKCDFLINAQFYQDYQIMRILRQTKDGISSKSLLDEVSKAIETAYATMVYELNLVKKGGNKKGFLQSERKLGDQEISKLKDSWNRMYATNEENCVVLNNGLKFQESSNSSVEMQLNQSKTTLDAQIDSIFHISSNFEDTYKEGIHPIVVAFESALNRYMLLENEKKQGYYFAFDTKEITRANIKERYEVYKMAKEIGMNTINELRQEEKLNAIDGLDVINVGLGAVLFDIDKKEYYTPNTNTTSSANGEPLEDEPLEENNEPNEGSEDLKEKGV